jgi:hypothetical protein
MRARVTTFVVLLAAAWSALVQADETDRGAQCVTIADDGARLDCYDRAFSRGDSAVAPAPAAASVSPAPGATSASSAPTAASAPPAPAATSAPPAPAATSAPPAASGGGEPSATPAELTAAFGAEDLGREDAEPEAKIDSLEARVIEVQPDRRGKHVYRLDNGQTWQQVEGTDLVPVRVEDTVKIWRGAFDSYRLRRTDGGRTVTVRRTN